MTVWLGYRNLGFKNQGAAKSTGQIAVYMLIPVAGTRFQIQTIYPSYNKGQCLVGIMVRHTYNK